VAHRSRWFVVGLFLASEGLYARHEALFPVIRLALEASEHLLFLELDGYQVLDLRGTISQVFLHFGSDAPVRPSEEVVPGVLFNIRSLLRGVAGLAVDHPKVIDAVVVLPLEGNLFSKA